MFINIDLKFPRESRLLTKLDYSQVFENPKKFSSGPFTFLVRPNGLARPRLGVILSKKKISLAVQRNRVRRIIRESFRAQVGLGGADIVVLPKHGTDSLSNVALKKGLMREWKKCADFLSQL